MVNRYRGEISACIGGRERKLVLTLGALAELEEAFAVDNLVALAERFERGHLSARDLMRILHAGLKGAGETLTLDELAQEAIEGGVPRAAERVAALLQITFGGAEDGGNGVCQPEK